jgi:hypothetical protein
LSSFLFKRSSTWNELESDSLGWGLPRLAALETKDGKRVIELSTRVFWLNMERSREIMV